MKKKCTTSKFADLNNDVTKFLNDGNKDDLITVDFSKAFDTILHKKLLHKLLHFGINGCVFIIG